MVYKLLSTLGPKKKIQYNQNLLVSLSFGGHGPHNIGIIRYTHTHTHTHLSILLTFSHKLTLFSKVLVISFIHHKQ